MMTATQCPKNDELKALTLGQLPERESDLLFEHLRECDSCRSQLETVEDTNDSLISYLRSDDEKSPFDQEPDCQVAVAKALGALAEVSSKTTKGTTHDLARLPKQIGEYEIVRPLGHGGMGSVYLARHSKLGREVALKVLSSHRLADSRMRERFENEMRAIGRLSHPNVVTAHDAREVDGTAVLVTEYIEGMDLGRLVERTGPLAIGVAAQVAKQVAVALQYTHDQGFVHRDVKPSNVMVSEHGEVKLLDLGLARLQFGDSDRADITGTGQAMGTADYVAPEQVTDSRAVDARADVYSLGCTLFKLLTGTAPFADDQHLTAFAKMSAHVNTQPPPLTSTMSNVPAGLAKLVDSMLSKDPAKRPQSMESVAKELSAFVEKCDLGAIVADAKELEPVEQVTRASTIAKATKPLLQRLIPMWAAIALGAAALFGGFLFGVIITIKYPDGTIAKILAPTGAIVEMEEGGEEGGGDSSGSTTLGLGSQPAEATDNRPLSWTPYDPKLLADFRRDGRGVFLHFTADWCLQCDSNIENAIDRPLVRDCLRQNGFVTVQADWTNRNDGVRNLLKSLGANSLPLSVVIPAGENKNPVLLQGVLREEQVAGAVLNSLGASPVGADDPLNSELGKSLSDFEGVWVVEPRKSTTPPRVAGANEDPFGATGSGYERHLLIVDKDTAWAAVISNRGERPRKSRAAFDGPPPMVILGEGLTGQFRFASEQECELTVKLPDTDPFGSGAGRTATRTMRRLTTDIPPSPGALLELFTKFPKLGLNPNFEYSQVLALEWGKVVDEKTGAVEKAIPPGNTLGFAIVVDQLDAKAMSLALGKLRNAKTDEGSVVSAEADVVSVPTESGTWWPAPKDANENDFVEDGIKAIQGDRIWWLLRNDASGSISWADARGEIGVMSNGGLLTFSFSGGLKVKMLQMTEANIGKPMAVVVNDQVVTVSRLNDALRGRAALHSRLPNAEILKLMSAVGGGLGDPLSSLRDSGPLRNPLTKDRTGHAEASNDPFGASSSSADPFGDGEGQAAAASPFGKQEADPFGGANPFGQKSSKSNSPFGNRDSGGASNDPFDGATKSSDPFGGSSDSSDPFGNGNSKQVSKPNGLEGVWRIVDAVDSGEVRTPPDGMGWCIFDASSGDSSKINHWMIVGDEPQFIGNYSLTTALIDNELVRRIEFAKQDVKGTNKGIMRQLSNGQLQICVNEERGDTEWPDAFVSEPSSANDLVMTLERLTSNLPVALKRKLAQGSRDPNPEENHFAVLSQMFRRLNTKVAASRVKEIPSSIGGVVVKDMPCLNALKSLKSVADGQMSLDSAGFEEAVFKFATSLGGEDLKHDMEGINLASVLTSFKDIQSLSSSQFGIAEDAPWLKIPAAEPKYNIPVRFEADFKVLVYEQIGPIVDRLFRQKGMFDEVQEGLLEDPDGPKFNLKQLVAQLGDELIVYVHGSKESGSPEVSEKWLVAIKHTNKDAVADLLADVPDEAEFTIRPIGEEYVVLGRSEDVKAARQRYLSMGVTD